MTGADCSSGFMLYLQSVLLLNLSSQIKGHLWHRHTQTVPFSHAIPEREIACECWLSHLFESLPELLLKFTKTEIELDPRSPDIYFFSIHIELTLTILNMSFNLRVWSSDGELYAGTSADFMGRDFAIFRTLGKHHPIRTEQHDSRWLNGET